MQLYKKKRKKSGWDHDTSWRWHLQFYLTKKLKPSFFHCGKNQPVEACSTTVRENRKESTKKEKRKKIFGTNIFFSWNANKRIDSGSVDRIDHEAKQNMLSDIYQCYIMGNLDHACPREGEGGPGLPKS